MPGGDGTGPLGLGAMTGRAAGFCAGFGVPGYANPMLGRGFGGRGRGLGWGRGPGRGWRARGWAVAPSAMPPAGWPQPVPGQEADALKQQADYLQGELDAIRKRLDELAATPTTG